MVVQGLVGDGVVVALNGRDDLFSGKYTSVALHQEGQDPEFGFRQFQRLAVQKRFTFRGIENQSSDLNQVWIFIDDSLLGSLLAVSAAT